ncbi:hypothetical protein MCCC1A01412_27045 [Bacillus anthracis]|nr:hypothetical protein DY471_18630 [Bacillus anthracis]OJD83412.1 hypothetical protein MCCC1A01412_27045 [Bacillus anthracis]
MGDGGGLNEMLFLVFDSQSNLLCKRRGALLFFQLLNNVGTDECNTLSDWKKDKTSRTAIET